MLVPPSDSFGKAGCYQGPDFKLQFYRVEVPFGYVLKDTSVVTSTVITYFLIPLPGTCKLTVRARMFPTAVGLRLTKGFAWVYC